MGSVKQLRNLLRFYELSPLSPKSQLLKKKFSGSGSVNVFDGRRGTGDKGDKGDKIGGFTARIPPPTNTLYVIRTKQLNSL